MNEDRNAPVNDEKQREREERLLLALRGILACVEGGLFNTYDLARPQVEAALAAARAAVEEAELAR